MGWASGSYLAERIWATVQPLIPETEQQKVAKKIYDEFSQEDADDWDPEVGGLWSIAEPMEFQEYIADSYEGMEAINLIKKHGELMNKLGFTFDDK